MKGKAFAIILVSGLLLISCEAFELLSPIEKPQQTDYRHDLAPISATAFYNTLDSSGDLNFIGFVKTNALALAVEFSRMPDSSTVNSDTVYLVEDPGGADTVIKGNVKLFVEDAGSTKIIAYLEVDTSKLKADGSTFYEIHVDNVKDPDGNTASGVSSKFIISK